MKRILLVGGGSGGHVFPLIAVADALREKARQEGLQLDLRLIGDGRFITQAAREADLKLITITAGKFRRYFSFLNILDFFKAILSFIQSLWLMYWYMPDTVFTKGGYTSMMPAIAAKLYFIPLIIHDSDSVPGAANRIISKISNKVLISFESSQKYFKMDKTMLVGNPVRKELAQGDKGAAINFFKLDANKPTVLVLGGSQGAKRINDLVLDSIVQIVKNYQLIHQCGDSQYVAIKTEIEKHIKEGEASYGVNISNNYRLYKFFGKEEIKLAYSMADVIISRGGAGSIFEIAMIGKPAIIIPIANSTGNHQVTNAIEFSKFGASVLEEANLTPHILISQIASLLKPENYQAISAKIKSFARPEAASIIAELLLQF